MNFLTDNNLFIDIHSHHSHNEPNLLRIFNQFLNKFKENSEELLVSIGLHPWHIHEYQKIDILEDELFEAAKNKKVVFIGEAGLDRIKNKDMTFQVEVFKKHVRISEKTQKPLIIHCVRAHDELIKIKNEVNPKQSWIIHGFDSSPELAASMAKLGFFLSIGERLLKKPEKSRMVLDCIPLSRLFIESDDSKIPINFLYDQVASIYSLEVKELKEYIVGNFNSLFHE